MRGAVVIIMIFAFAVCGCAKEEKNKIERVHKAAQKSDASQSGKNQVTKMPIVDSLKKKKLNKNSEKTIGEVFDSYSHVVSKEWRETGTNTNKYYADYICWFDVKTISMSAIKDGVAKSGLELKFVIHEDGEAFIVMGTRVEIKNDGNLYRTILPLSDVASVVDKIYANQEIKF